jgi:valyl-tRNA synthetase
MDELIKPAVKAVQDKEIRLIPERMEKTYFNWTDNIKDWCISRQLWWGHRIPAYYCDSCGETVVARTEPTVCPKCTFYTGSRYAGYLVFIRAVALLHPRLAGKDEGAGIFLSD